MIVFKTYKKELPILIRSGKVLLHPTDTVWGLAASISQRAAVERIYKIKNREKTKPFILLVDSLERLKAHVFNLHPRIETLLSYHRRPLTIIYEKTKGIPDYLKGEDGSIGIRIVNDFFCRKLIQDIDEPLVSTSANIAYEKTPISYDEISPSIIEQSDVIFYPQVKKLNQTDMPSVIARLSEKDELIFLRT